MVVSLYCQKLVCCRIGFGGCSYSCEFIGRVTSCRGACLLFPHDYSLFFQCVSLDHFTLTFAACLLFLTAESRVSVRSISRVDMNEKLTTAKRQGGKTR